MTRLIVRRLLLMVPTLILVSMPVSALAEWLPGDVGAPSWGRTRLKRRSRYSTTSWAPTDLFLCVTPTGSRVS